MYYKRIEEVAEAEFVGMSERSSAWEMRELREENHFLKTDNELLKEENEEFDKRISRIEKINNTLLEQNEMLLESRKGPRHKEMMAFAIGFFAGIGAAVYVLDLPTMFAKVF